MKIYETDFRIRFILLIRVKRVIIGDTREGLGIQEEAPKNRRFGPWPDSNKSLSNFIIKK